MCSINGAYFNNRSELEYKRGLELFKTILINAQQRGKDSFGITQINEDGFQFTEKYVGKMIDHSFQIYDMKSTTGSKTKIILSNNRAEPTTEYVKNKKLTDVQPFFNDDHSVAIVHNGTIANDKELIKECDLKLNTKIDSAVIPHILEIPKNDILLNKDDENYVAYVSLSLMNRLIGSYSLAIWNKQYKDTLLLATNYKPLYVMFYKGNMFYSSLKEFFGIKELGFGNEDYNIVEIEPYTLVEISDAKIINSHSLYKVDYHYTKKKKALIIASSGLDSTVCASWAKDKGYDITLLHFRYGCRAQISEHKAINRIKDFFNCNLIEIPVDFFKNTIKHSRLYNEGKDLVKTNDGESSAELAHEWVPARNLIFMSIAAGYAEANNFDYIVLGGNLEESGAYPDNEYIFQKKFNDLLPHALNLQHKVQVLTPIANLMKHEIVKLGLKLKAPLHLTWSCYENGDIHCGQCGPDYMRRTAFKMNGVKDVIPYKFTPDNFWDDCK